MRTEGFSHDQLTEITRRRLELLSAEIAGARAASPVRLDETPDVSVDRPAGRAPRDAPDPLKPGRHARRPVGARLRALAWLQDRLPATVQGRVELGSAHLVVLAGAVAVGLAVSAWWVLRSDDGGTLVPVSARADAGVSVPIASPTAGGSATPSGGVVVVDVTGRVRRPGIATLPAGARVIDALRAAGGVRPGVALVSINRARLLVDGEQIVVGTPPPGSAAAAALGGVPGGPTLVNLNLADEAALDALPGVGPVTAQAIIAWRTENGGFHSVDQLLDVSGIGDATLAELAPHVTL
ncbi:MAG TPA: helix-hairpin-helix domain-containing protein [Nocardioidaceae bacterium]|nr:helix-hairpin-helix domain-containing protein [Nocardioidaceae bacterium]